MISVLPAPSRAFIQQYANDPEYQRSVAWEIARRRPNAEEMPDNHREILDYMFSRNQ